MPTPARRLSAAALCLAAAAGFAAVTPAQDQPLRRPNFLSEEQINRIKQQELRPRDAGEVSFRFLDDVLREFPKGRPDLTYEQFDRGSDMEKALFILQNGTAEQAADVVVRGDPLPLRVWREEVGPVVLRGCATSACHGTADPADAAGWYLYPNADSEDARYTNFYATVAYQSKIGDDAGDDRQAEGGNLFPKPDRQMVDRQRPARSLLLEYMLPPDVSQTPHPTVPGQGYDGVVQSTDDDRYQLVGRWIETLAPTLERYDVAFQPDGLAPDDLDGELPTTQPAQ